eukprot:5363313-Prymnesium_polylepis.1
MDNFMDALERCLRTMLRPPPAAGQVPAQRDRPPTDASAVAADERRSPPSAPTRASSRSRTRASGAPRSCRLVSSLPDRRG